MMRRTLPPFAEKILYQIPGATNGPARVEPRWADGLFLGLSDKTDELFIGTPEGMVRARTIRRREATQRYDQEFLDKFTAVPWDRRGARPAAVRLTLPTVPAPAPAGAAEGAGGGEARRVYIKKSDLVEYGVRVHGELPGVRGCCCRAAAEGSFRGMSTAARAGARQDARWSGETGESIFEDNCFGGRGGTSGGRRGESKLRRHDACCG